MKKSFHTFTNKTFIVVSVLLFMLGFSMQAEAQSNYALRMNNASDGVLFDSPVKKAGNAWTIEMWVKRNGQSNFSTLIDGANTKLTLETWAPGNNWTYKVGLKGSSDLTFNYVMPLNQWTHLAFVCNGSTTLLYVNGDGKGRINEGIEMPMKGIGLLGNPNESPKASIDEIRFWNEVRSQAQIREYMSKSVDLNSENLIGYFYFDDQSDKITDLSGNGMDGTNKGCVYEVNNNPFETLHDKMELMDITATHSNEYLLKAGDKNQEILSVEVNTNGVSDPLKLSALTVTMDGTSNLDFVDKIGIATTGSNRNFSADKLIGAKLNPKTGNITFDADVSLNPGTSYLWIVYDIAANATKSSVFDATLVSAVIDSKTVTPLVSNPNGNRKINDVVKQASSSTISIIPKPSSMTATGDMMVLTSDFKVKYEGENTKVLADSLALFINEATGFNLNAVSGGAEAKSIALKVITDSSLGDEGYRMSVTSDRVVIEAQSGVGLFWGIQSLRQLLPADIESKTLVKNVDWSIPTVEITDIPRFKLRSMHLDVARHFFDANFVKKYIDVLSLYKINTFHWHLTEDQGWRIEIKKYPKLQSISAFRNCPDDPTQNYGGYYTHEEIKDIVAYASSKNINIIPEIEMPGHSVSVLAAYPEFACTSAKPPFNIWCGGGISHDILCGGKETVRQFFKDVLLEVVELFPGPYIHIGGDEAPKTNWNTCADCKAKIVALGITGSDQTNKSNKLQKDLVEEMAQFLAPYNRRVIGWDEITHGGIPTGAIIQKWNPSVNVFDITNAGHSVIVSNYNNLYFDSKQVNDPNEPGVTWMGINTLEKVYNFDPMPGGLSAEQQKHVLGSEACIWTEIIKTEERVEHMLLPRLLALAERGWTPNSEVNLSDFKNRLANHYERFSVKNLNAWKLPMPKNEYRMIESCETVVLTPAIEGTSYYWNDATNSTSRSLTVSESGRYKCYVGYMGEVIEQVYDVEINAVNSTPEVKVNRLENETEYKVEGEYGVYNWYQNENDTYPQFSGSDVTLTNSSNGNDMFVSGFQLVNSLNSLQLTGADDLVEIENSNFLNNTKAFTLETWVKINSWRTWDVLFAKRTDNQNRIVLEMGNQGELYAHISKSGGNYGVASNAIKVGEWTHVAMVYDATKSGNANRLKLYINGYEQALNFTGTIPTSTATVSNPLQLGLATQNPSANFAEVRVWDVARSEEEIQANLNGLKSFDETLRFYYPMSDVADVMYDATKGNKAIVKNPSQSLVSGDAAPNLKVAACESQRWKVESIANDVTGVKGIQSDLGVKIFPNPTTGQLTMDVSLKSIEDVLIQILGVNGQTYYREKLISSSFTKSLDLSRYNSGLYFLNIKAGESENTQKLILQ